MKTEREAFEIEAREYEDCDLSRNEDGSYKNDLTHTCFYWWCKSVSREGYKLVTVEPSADLVNHGHQVFLGHFNEGGQTGGRSLYFAYKAMIEAQENKG